MGGGVESRVIFKKILGDTFLSPVGCAENIRRPRVGGAALAPVRDAGRDLGVRAQAHLYLPAIFPDFHAKPMFGN
jgi:hypothetical protein